MNGVFHGDGTLYVKGGRFTGEWSQGKLIKGDFIFDDELPYNKSDSDWTYCTSSDQRFFREVCEGVPKEGPLKYPSPNPTTPVLPKGCYDMVIGYYDPREHSIKTYDKHEEIRRPPDAEKQWMVANCRVGTS